METLAERIKRVTQEHISIVSYNPIWPELFEEEKNHLQNCLPRELIGRIEHFGSTAIPRMAAKPIVDMLVEVSSLEETKSRIVPLLEAQGYDYFWRPTSGDGVPPFYAWFIKRDTSGNRTHHIHMIEKDFEQWERLLFRDYLIERPELAREYEVLKLGLARDYPNDRVAYTGGKTEFVKRVTQQAREHYALRQPFNSKENIEVRESQR
ncbi:MAG: GrpB family protein [Pyrinomonadaceae bacterium]